MELRPFRLALVLAGAAVLAACTGATGTVEDDAQADSQASGDATTSGTGDDTISSTGGAVADPTGTGGTATAGRVRGRSARRPRGFAGHPHHLFRFRFERGDGVGSGHHRGARALSLRARRRPDHPGGTRRRARVARVQHRTGRTACPWGSSAHDAARRDQPPDSHHQLRRRAARGGRARRVLVAAQSPGRDHLSSP